MGPTSSVTSGLELILWSHIHFLQVKHCSTSIWQTMFHYQTQDSKAAKTSHTSSQQQPASSASPEDCGGCVGAANVGCKSRLQKSRSSQHPTTYPFSTSMLVVFRHHKGNPGGKRTLLLKHLDKNSAIWVDPSLYLHFSGYGEYYWC
jgi:hypothetical protein